MTKRLLTEAQVLGDGDWEKVMGPVKKALGHFGKTVSASAKLIGTDVATIIKFNFSLTRSLSSQKQIMDNWSQNRTKHIKTIYENSSAALEALGPDKYTCMAMCPSVYWGVAAYRGTGALISEETRNAIGEYGAGSLPIIGTLFGGQKARGTRDSFFDSLVRGSDAPPGSNEAKEEMKQSLTRYFNDLGDELGFEKGKNPGTLMNIFYKINDIFLFASHERLGNVLREGEEKKEGSVKEDAEEALTEIVKEYFLNSFEEERSGYLKEHEETYEPIIDAVAKIISVNMQLAKTDDPAEFMKILQDSVKKNKELKDINVENLQQEFDKMVIKLSEDPKIIQQLRMDLEKKGDLEPIPDEADSGKVGEKEKKVFESALKKVALDNCKGNFLQVLKEAATDLYENMRFAVTDGLQEETMRLIEKEAKDDEIAMKFISQIKDFQERLDEAMSKLKK